MGTRLKRITNKIFGSTASTVGSVETGAEIGQFGSAKLGTYNATADVEEIQSLSAYNKGWIDAVIPSQQYPTLPEMTGVNKVMSYQTGYIMQEGIAEWDSGTEYFLNSIVKYTPKTENKNVSAEIGENTGITGADVDSETFLSQISSDGTYTFTFNGSSWLYNDIVTDLTLYGITVTGTAVSGDEIIVTEETVTSYGEMNLYKSVVDNNINNDPLENSSSWEILNFGSDLPPAEDGYLNCSNGIISWKNIQEGSVYPFSSFYGNYDNATGYPDLISYSGSTATFKVSDYTSTYIPLRCCFTDNTIKEFVSIADLDTSLLPNGTYNLYIDKNGTVQPYANTQYASRIVVGGGSSTIVYVDKFQLSSNLSKVGSPTINSTTGVLTNITANNYLQTPSGAKSYMSATNWEVQVKFKYSQTISNTAQMVFGNCYTSGGYSGCNIEITSSGKLKIIIRYGSNATSWQSSSALSTNTYYTVNVKYDGSKYTATGGGINQTLTTSTSTSWATNYPLYFGRYYSTVNGWPAKYVTIDLMNSYVKSNGNFVINNIVKEEEIITTGGDLEVDDMWLDTNEKPYILRQYDGTNWNAVDYVRLPQQITVSSGAITGIVNVLPFNANGWDEQLSTPDFNRQTALTNGVQFTAPLKGYVYKSNTNIQYIDEGFKFTPSSTGWYFSPLKGV